MSTFKLQQFAIRQRDNAMKACTDSLIFGALTPVTHAQRVLDIGTGTGLLSLMAKQRGAKYVVGVELIEKSAQEAQYNIVQSPWPNAIEIICNDINQYHNDNKFDVIISNPPFFDDHLKNPDIIKNTARHTDTLDYRQLLTQATTLLTNDGTISLLLPIHTLKKIHNISAELNLTITKQINLITMQGGVAKLAVIELKQGQVTKQLNIEEITIFKAHQEYSTQSATLLQNFLLRFAHQQL